MWSDFCLNRQDIIFANRTAELRGLKLSPKSRKRRIIFLFDWRNTPNSHRNQYKADRWFSIEQRSLKKRGKLTWFSQPMNSLFSDIWIRWRILKGKTLLQRFPFYTARFLRTRHFARRAFYFPFPLSKISAVESRSVVQFSILFNVVGMAFHRSVLFDPSSLQDQRFHFIRTPLIWPPTIRKSCNRLLYKLLWRIRWEDRHTGWQNCTGVHKESK